MAIVDISQERFLEENLIDFLVQSGHWTYHPELNTEEKLWDNLRDIIEKNNKAILKENRLTDKEFAQVKNQLSFPSFFEAAKALRGENGKVKVSVQREDQSLGRVMLLILDNRDIAGGTSVYQIINQYQAPRIRPMDSDSRFDVSLLINGLPLIHIELKSRAVGYMESFNQIREYVREGKFRGIYSACQMFVVSNGANTRYIAPASHDRLNAKFLSRWVDEENNPIEDLSSFARSVLTIPAAHRLVSKYTVLDYDNESLIILRPYQIHAIRAVMDAFKAGSGGYVWHTTGSGKTLTSYKVANNLLEVPMVDKSVFIVDRVDLDNQTSGAFTSYAKGDFVDIDETDNVRGLVSRLIDDRKSVIVTTIQKLNYLIKRYEGKKDSKTCRKLRELSLVFVVDECHRAVSSEKQLEINRFFNRPRWFGFTGTPIFAENQKKAYGNLARTTKEQYGDCLHQYTVRHAIEDKAVLGFQLEYKSTISEDDFYDIIKTKDPDIDFNNSDRAYLESLIDRKYYEKDAHMVEVIDTIVNKSRLKFGLDRGPGKTFSAILTTSSIEKAQRYYELFCDLKEGRLDIKISDKVRKLMPDFPKVAITYSIAQNQEETGLNKEKMKKALADYNESFGTNFSLDEVKAYNSNLNERLARKKSLYGTRSEQVDLVIVVDRLLTGFDSPTTALLFIDRAPMTPQNLIQAFSRTNRIYNSYKTYGQIVTFQTPEIYEQRVEEAFSLYSNGGEDYIKAPSFDESLAIFENALASFNECVGSPSDVDKLKTLDEKMAFAKAFQGLDKALANIRVYGEYDEEEFFKKYDLSYKALEEYNGKYVNIIEEIREELGDKEVEDDKLLDIGYETLTVGVDEIDSSYLNRLMNIASKKGLDLPRDEREKSKEFIELRESLEKASKSNPKKIDLYRQVTNEILADPSKYKDVDMGRYMDNIVYGMYEQGITKLATETKVPYDKADYYAKIYKRENDNGNYLLEYADIDQVKKEQDLNPLKAKKYVRGKISTIMKEDIEPYKS
ncbi:type I restriction endonuclease subunit R [Anaerococcus sp. AGMB09787]|uniref:type I restriction endonuclease subunit R n=1 Tax=Anaerococcus sp. AGMB09787 TaxID=2922869 RepID=UPI001FAE8546|nr:type I restriction endonuclease subunit R [Anaerococcus sp. AGMB09787]